MSDQDGAPEVQEVDISVVEEQAPELATALGGLEKALGAYIELQEEILPLQAKGLAVPNLPERTHRLERAIADALDTVQPLLRKYESKEAVLVVAMKGYQEGMMYMQGILFGIHYARVSTRHDKPFRRLHEEAYHLLSRQRSRLEV